MDYHQRQTQRAIQQTIQQVISGLGWVVAFHGILILVCLGLGLE